MAKHVTRVTVNVSEVVALPHLLAWELNRLRCMSSIVKMEWGVKLNLSYPSLNSNICLPALETVKVKLFEHIEKDMWILTSCLSILRRICEFQRVVWNVHVLTGFFSFASRYSPQSRDGSLGLATGNGLDDRGIGVRFLAESRDTYSSLLDSFQTVWNWSRTRV